MNWLTDLRTGDEVVYYHRGRGDAHIEKVERVTKTLVIVNNIKFRRFDGFSTGNEYYASFINEATPELIVEIKNRIRRTKRIDFIRNTPWQDFSNEKLKEISRVIVSE